MNLPRPKHSGMRHVALNVVDINAMEHFYSGLLGFEVEWRPDPENVYLSSGTDNLALHVVNDRGGKRQALAHTGIIVDSIDDVDLWYDYLIEQSVKMGSQPRTHRDGARSFYCFDPEENVVQVLYHPPLSTE